MENAVIFEQRNYLSADKRTQIHAYIWRPEGAPLRGIIQISHGMCEYMMRYDAWARRFCEIGFVVCGNDHLGHGQNAENAAELGFIPQTIGADCLVEDLHTMSELIKAEYPELPLVLYGHSMGSFVLRAYLSRYGEALSAALISGTAGAGQPTGVARQLARTIAAAFTGSLMAGKDCFGSARLAAGFVEQVAAATEESSPFGVAFENQLPWLWNQL